MVINVCASHTSEREITARVYIYLYTKRKLKAHSRVHTAPHRARADPQYCCCRVWSLSILYYIPPILCINVAKLEFNASVYVYTYIVYSKSINNFQVLYIRIFIAHHRTRERERFISTRENKRHRRSISIFT